MTPTNWVWTDQPLPPRNRFVRFRANLPFAGGPLTLHLTADTRYLLWVNGRLIGNGPVRAWPNHWRYDSYDLAPHLRPGDNALAVLINHYNEATFQSLHAPAGLLARTDPAGELVWRASVDPARVAIAPRISCQLPFEEQYDARAEESWQRPEYDDAAWPLAVAAPEAEDCHRNLEPRGIPFLTEEPVLPLRLISAEAVRSEVVRWTVNFKDLLWPSEKTANMCYAHGYLATQVWSPRTAEVGLRSVHKWPCGWQCNGQPIANDAIVLREGWNSLLLSLHGMYHVAEVDLAFDGLPDGARFSAAGEAGGSPWAVCGPFGLTERDEANIYHDKDDSLNVARPWLDEATAEVGESFWAAGDVAAAVGRAWWQTVPEHDLPAADAFTQAYTDTKVGDLALPVVDGLVSGAEWFTLEPPAEGDLRLLLDFGQEIVAHHEFEVDAPAGTILDFHNFEFIQPDGRYNFAEGMNNSLRYVCGDGPHAFRSWLRRGFRYSYLIVRDAVGPLKLRGLKGIFASYPQRRDGWFACSDAQLDRIWEIGAHSLRCCAEDTYTDCPTYEQTHWVGDARNEALIDWTANGDGRLWYRCLEQVGDSLERSPVIESLVPTGWQNILPTFCFLWMRSCCEYYEFTGDRDGFGHLLDCIDRQVDGLAANTSADGLFGMRAWNMFDWAAMDCPSRGYMTHHQCNGVIALRQAAASARGLGQVERAQRWEQLAAIWSAATNRLLWVEERGAYADCLRVRESHDVVRGPQRELVLSEVFSQQTQTVAVIADVASGARSDLCRGHMHHPPEGFVKAGSPYFEFFLLEAYQQEGRDEELVDTIRRDWGFMADMGATTFWEMWSGHQGRLTRSHCHGWSGAPTFFLSTWVLGVRPGGPGFSPCLIEPHPGGLRWARGAMPTPLGPVEVQWEDEPGQPFALRVKAPPGLALDVRLPREGEWALVS